MWWFDTWIYCKIFTTIKLLQDVRAIWLWHLSPHWSPGLIWLIWLARWVSPFSLTTPHVSLPKLHAPLKRTNKPKTIKLLTTSFNSHDYHFVTIAVVMVRTLNFYSQSNIQVCDTVPLAIATVLYIRSLEFIHLITEGLYPLANISPFLLPLSSWKP